MKIKTQPTRNCGTQKSCPERKFIAMSAYIKNTKRSQINEQMIHLKLLEKQEQENPKRKEGEK
jgi:hypothetical protein